MKVRKVILIFGQTGSGKSFLARRIMKGFPRLVIFDPNGEYDGFTVRSFGEFVRYMETERKSYRVICQYDEEEDFELTAQAVWILGDCCLVLEECQTFLGATEESTIQRLITRGRHRRVSIIGISPRPVEIPPRLRSQCQTVVSFMQVEKRDVDFLCSWGFNEEELRTLPKYTYALVGDALEISTS